MSDEFVARSDEARFSDESYIGELLCNLLYHVSAGEIYGDRISKECRKARTAPNCEFLVTDSLRVAIRETEQLVSNVLAGL